MSGVEPARAAPSHDLSGIILSQRYGLTSLVGSGGMASVFKARDLRLQRDVAVKVLRPHLASEPEIAARFQREAQYAARLSGHANIVAIHDVGEWTQLQYIVMELIGGRSLRQVLDSSSRLPLAATLEVVKQVAAALDYAHHHAIIHRDVKPENILLAPDGQVKVTDFGIAHSVGADRLTRTGLMVGTASYVSPEQATGQAIGPASDIYALGVVTFEMLTGRTPFQADTPLGVALLHAQEPPPPPEIWNPALPATVSRTILRALDKTPGTRHPAAGDFASALVQSAVSATAGQNVRHRSVRSESDDRPGEKKRRLGRVSLSLFLCLFVAAALAAWQASGTSHGHALPDRSPATRPPVHGTLTRLPTPLSRAQSLSVSTVSAPASAPTSTPVPSPTVTPLPPPPTYAPASPPPPKHEEQVPQRPNVKNDQIKGHGRDNHGHAVDGQDSQGGDG